MTTLWLAWRNLMRHRLRAALMLVSVAVAFALYGTLFGFNNLLGGGDVSGGRDLMVHHRAGILQTLPAHYRSAIERTRGVESVASVAIIGGYVGERANKVPTQMVDAAAYLAQNADSVVLAPDQRAAFLATRDGVIVDERTAREKRWLIGDAVVITSEMTARADGGFAWPFRLVGVFRAARPEDAIHGAIAHIEYLNEGAAFGRDRVHWFGVRTRNSSVNDRVIAAIDARFANSEAETRTEPAAAMARAFLSQVVDFALVIRIIVSAAFFTILMVVGNTMALAVRQRRREFGVLRALGFDAGRVSRIVLTESLTIAVLGASIGLLLSTALLALITAAITGGPPSLAALPLKVPVTGLGLAVLFGIVTALLPTYRAARIRPAEAFSRS